MAKGWVGTISPPGVLAYMEEECRGVWQTGNAVFMRNWPYAYALGNGADSPIKGKFDVAPLPSGGGDNTSAATLGGWNLAVSRYSPNPEVATELALYMASTEYQKALALKLAPADDPARSTTMRNRHAAVADPALEGHLPERGAAALGADQGRLQRGLVQVLDRGPRALSRHRHRRREPRAARARSRRDEGRRLVSRPAAGRGRGETARREARPPAPRADRGGSDVTTTTVSGLPPRGTGSGGPAGEAVGAAGRAGPRRAALPPADDAGADPRRRLAAAPHDLLQLHRHLAHQPRRAASGSASTTT